MAVVNYVRLEALKQSLVAPNSVWPPVRLMALNIANGFMLNFGKAVCNVGLLVSVFIIFVLRPGDRKIEVLFSKTRRRASNVLAASDAERL